MSETVGQTFLGIDFGSYSVKIAHAHALAAPPGASEPEFFRSKNNENVFLTSILTGPTGKILGLGREITAHSDYLNEGIHIQYDPLLRAIHGDPNGLELVCGALAQVVRREYNVVKDQPLPAEIVTVVSIPANIDPLSPYAQALFSALSKAGFPKIRAMPTPTAVTQSAQFSGCLPVANAPLDLLVVDLGARASSLTHLRLENSSSAPTVCRTCEIQWSGNQADELIYYDLILKQFWRSDTDPSVSETERLLFAARLLKHSAFARFKKGEAVDEKYTRELHVEDPIRLSRDSFIHSNGYQNLISSLKAQIEQSIANEFAGIDFHKVIINGGGANYPLVSEILSKVWGSESIILLPSPELHAARGAAISQTGFQPAAQIAKMPEPKQTVGNWGVLQQDPIPQVSSPQPQSSPGISKTEVLKKLNAVHDASRKSLIAYILIGALVALMVSFLPCFSWPFLMMVEIVMFYRLTRNYNYNVSDSIFIVLCLGLFGLSIVLTLVIGIFVEMFPIINIALKPLIAALVIWSMGEGAIWALDKQSEKDNYRNIIQGVL